MKILSIGFKNPFHEFGYTNTIKLNNLDDINVFIGKNNSGKTTILKTLGVLLNRSHGSNKSIIELSIKLNYEELKKLLKTCINKPEYLKNRSSSRFWSTSDDDRLQCIGKLNTKLDSDVLEPLLNSNFIELKIKRVLENNTITSKFIFNIEENPESIIDFKEQFRNLGIHLLDLHEKIFDYIISLFKKFNICALRRLESGKDHISEDLEQIHNTVNILFSSSINPENLNDGKYRYELFEIPNFSLILDFIRKNELLEKVKQKLTPSFFEEFFKNIKEFFPNFNIAIDFSRSPLQTWQEIDENGIKFRSWKNLGHGHQQIISLLFLLMLPDNYIYLIDEPDIGLHPGLQRKLLHFIKEKIITDIQYSKQFFFATHSTSFIDFKGNCSHFICEKTKNNFSVELLEKDKLNILRDVLGLSPSALLQANGIIWVEGPSDRFYIKMLFTCFGVDLDEKGVLIMPYNGKDYIIKPHISQELLTDVNPNFMVIMDSDKKGTSAAYPIDQSKLNIRNKYVDAGKKFWLIGKYCDIEGVIPQEVLNEYFEIILPLPSDKVKRPYQKLDVYINDLKSQELTAENSPNYGKDNKVSNSQKICSLILEKQNYRELIRENSYLKERITDLSIEIEKWI